MQLLRLLRSAYAGLYRRDLQDLGVDAAAGVRGMRFIEAVLKSASTGNNWCSL